MPYLEQVADDETS